MPLWFFPALMGLFAIISLAAGIWLLLHLQDVARTFRGTHEGEMIPGKGPRRASRAQVWLGIAIFNAGWLTCLLIWIFAIGGAANEVVNSGR